MKKEKTLVIIKPDGIQKQLIGEIISKIEKNNLKIKAIKMILADENILEKHYPLTEEWAKGLFEKSKSSAEKEKRSFEFTNHLEFGKVIQSRLKESLSQSPVIPMIIEGPKAIETIRKIIGLTEPKSSPKGTIRGDFASEESYELAEREKRAIKNLIHASSSLEDAEKEIKIWFEESEFYNY